jgi:hypothetical protein
VFYKPSQQNQVHEQQCKEMVGGNLWRYVALTTSAICGVKPERSRLKRYGNPWRTCHVIQSFSVSWKRHCWWGGSRQGKCPNWVGWSDQLSMPYGPTPYIFYTCCSFCFQYPSNIPAYPMILWSPEFMNPCQKILQL